jgi:hypothetical protein
MAAHTRKLGIFLFGTFFIWRDAIGISKVGFSPSQKFTFVFRKLLKEHFLDADIYYKSCDTDAPN